MAVLVVVFAVLVVSYASSMRAYLRQHSHINALHAQIASAREHIGELRQEKHRWHDKAYVEQQARARFGWVLPGETAYQVIGADGKPVTGPDRLSAPVKEPVTVPQPWWDRAYGSLERADHPERYAHAKPTPAKRIGPPGKHGKRQRSGS